MDYYMWVDVTTTEALLIPISDEAETFLKAEVSGIEERTNTSLLLKERKAYLIPSSGDSLFSKFNALVTTACSHEDIDHKTCVEDPSCEEKIRLISQAPTRKKNHNAG